MPVNSARAAPLRTVLPYEMPSADLDDLLDRSGILKLSRDVLCSTSSDGQEKVFVFAPAARSSWVCCSMLRQRRLTSLATLSSDGSLLMIILYVLSGPCSVKAHNLSWNREELISSTHPSKMYIVLFCLFIKRFQPKIFIIMVFLSIQNVVVRIRSCFGANICLVP